jgi:chromosome segregation ATPase
MPDSPASQKPKRGLLAGAKAYLGVSGKSKQASSGMSRTLSEPALHAPVTPKTPRGKLLSRDKNKKEPRPSAFFYDSPGEEESSSQLGASMDMSPNPQTPRAKQKIRRASLGLNARDASRGDTVSISDSDFAVSPSTTKPRRRAASAGPLDDVAKERGRKVREDSKEKKKTRHASSGPLERRSKRTPKTPMTAKHGSLRQLNDHLGDLELPLDGSIRDITDSPKLRTTVDGEGRIRRVKKSNGNVSDEEDGKSKYSTSSKRSKMSSKSTKSKKSVSKTKDKGDGKEKTKSTSGEVRRSSDGSEKSSRSTRKAESSEASERRAGKRSIATEDKSETNLRSSLESVDREYRRSGSGRSVGSPGNTTSRRDRGSTSNDDGFPSLPEARSDANGDDEVARLNKKIIELNQEILDIQFAAQAEAAKLKKELREEKLELQRCQSERRDLRTQLREREILVDESDRRIKALEKAVESQLDKVDELEEELRRANEEIFDLEGKLGGMEQVLAESSAIETTALQKEKDFREKREERMERRLEERERELEERERKLREELNAAVLNGDSQRNFDQLEQDNRMLLKTLNRERAEAMDKLNEKDEEVKRLEKELKVAKMRSYSRIGDASSSESLAKLLEDNAELQRRFDEETDQLNSALKLKDDRIASLEEQLKHIRFSGNLNGADGDRALLTEIESLKADLLVMRSKWESAQRRNQLLEEDVDHWKSVNCSLEDELADWKSQVANWRAKYEDMIDAEGGNDMHTHVSEPTNMLPFMMKRDQSAAQLALGRRDDEEDNNTTVSEPASSIANLWSKLTTPTSKRNVLTTMNSESVREVIARTTFH